MADKDDDLPPGDDSLLSEIDEWDKMFDTLHEQRGAVGLDDSLGEAGAGDAAPIGELSLEAAATEALAPPPAESSTELPSVPLPPPLPPPEATVPQPFEPRAGESTPRAPEPESPEPPTPAPALAPTPAPTAAPEPEPPTPAPARARADLERSGLFLPADDDFEAPFADQRTLAASGDYADALLDRLGSSAADDAELELAGEPRALGALLGRGPAPAAKPSRPGTGDDDLFTSAPRPRTLLPAAPDDAAIEDFSTDEVTNVLAPELVERMAVSAEAFFSEEPPEVSLELDDDFYADIEIGPADGELGRTPEPVATRRSVAHTVRRHGTVSGGDTTAVKEAPPELLDRISDHATPVKRTPSKLLSDPSLDDDEALDFDHARPTPIGSSEVIGSLRAATSAETAGFDDSPATAIGGAVVRDASRGDDEPGFDDSPATAIGGAVVRDRDPAEPSRFDDSRSTAVGGAVLPPAEPGRFDDSPSTAVGGAVLPPAEPGRFDDSPSTAVGGAVLPPASPAEPGTGDSIDIDLDAAPGELDASDSAEFAFEVDSAVDGMFTEPPPTGARGHAAEAPAEPSIELDGVVESALEGAVSLSTGTLLTGPELSEHDLPPELPPPVFADASPALDLSALRVPESAPPDLDDRTDEMARELVLCERELRVQSEPGATARLHIEAGRLAEALGDLDRARTHQDAALKIDPRQAPAVRALRRIERTLGNWSEVVTQLDAELGRASALERRGLAAYRADLLMALGEQDLARVAVGEVLDDAPSDVRALLANLELAYVDGRDDELDDTLGRLVGALAEDRLRASLELVRAHLAADGRDARARALALAPGAPAALLAELAATRPDDDDDAAADAARHGAAAVALADTEPALAASLAWRQAELADRAGDAAGQGAALTLAAELAAGDPFLAGAVARAAGADPEAAALWTRAAELDPVASAAAAAWRKVAARLDGDEALSAARRAVAADPADPGARRELGRRLEAAGDLDALIAADRGAATDPAARAAADFAAANRLAAAGRQDEAIAAAAELPPSWARDVLAVDLSSGPARARALIAIAASDAAHASPAQALERAAQILELAAAAAPDGDPATRADDRGRAASLWRRVLELDPERASAARALARLDASPDDVARARATLGEAAARVGLGLARLGELGDPLGPDAEEILRSAAADDPDDPRPEALLACVLARAGDWADVAAVWDERAAKLGTGLAADTLRFRAAAVLAERTSELGRAAELAAAVAAARPAFGAAEELAGSLRVQDERGVSGRGHDYAAALAEAQLDDAALAIRAGEAAEAAGDAVAAADSFRTALAARPDDAIARAGYLRVAADAGEISALAERALADLAAAKAAGDAAAQADACVELARIDGELRDDPASALRAWQEAAVADPERMSVLGALELRYAAADRHGELADLYQRIAAVTEGREAVAYLGESARRGQLAGRSDAEIDAAQRRILELDPHSRPALSRLERAERRRGPSPELAALEEAIADYFASDDRARAAFLVRSAETHGLCGDVDGATERFRRALDVVPGFAPALAGWRDLAVDGGRFGELAEAVENEAAATGDDARRAALHHLAGVTFMDRAGDDDRAIECFRRVLLADPAHRDAFVRLRRLLARHERTEELAAALAARLEVERDPEAIVALHRSRAELFRHELGDLATAQIHYRAILAVDEGDRRALAGIADLAWERADWAEAAEALMARARVERAPSAQKEIFHKLGTIYADRMPDPTWAIKSFQKVLSYDPSDRHALGKLTELATRTGQWRLALGACEKLMQLDPPPGEKVEILHRVAQVYLAGFEDAARAERAYRMALDLVPDSDPALDALVGFYREHGDERSARVHVDRVAGQMRARLAADVTDAAAYRVLARALAVRAGVAGSSSAARNAAELAQAFGVASPELAAIASAAPRPQLAGLTGEREAELLYPPSVPPELRALFGLLGERIAKHVGIDVRRHGVGRGDRLRKGSDPIAAMVLEVAGEMAIDDVDVYVTDNDPTVAAAEPTSPISLVLGRELVSLERPAELRFWIARELILARAWLSVPVKLGPERFAVLLTGILRQFAPEFTAKGLDESAAAAEQQRLRRLIPSGLLQELGPYALGLAGARLDPGELFRGLVLAGNRAGLLAAGSAAAAIAALGRAGGYRDIHQGAADPNVAALMRFAVSEEHVTLRALLAGAGR